MYDGRWQKEEWFVFASIHFDRVYIGQHFCIGNSRGICSLRIESESIAFVIEVSWDRGGAANLDYTHSQCEQMIMHDKTDEANWIKCIFSWKRRGKVLKRLNRKMEL